jgi:Fe-S cluster biogenesis protein NfuA
MGACCSCPVSTLTLKQGIERRIMMAVPEVKGLHAL